jgi:hypothetical protein
MLLVCNKALLYVLPGAQIGSLSAPGSTNYAFSCAREHKYSQFLLPGAQRSYCLCTIYYNICAKKYYNIRAQKCEDNICAQKQHMCSNTNTCM